MTPEQQGYIVGIVLEQVAEVAITAGAGAVLKGTALPRIAALLDKLPGAEKLGETLSALKRAASELRIGGKTPRELVLGAKNFLQDERGAANLNAIVTQLRRVFQAAKKSKLASELFVNAAMKTFKLAEGWLEAGRIVGVGKFDSLVYIVRDVKTGELLKVGETRTWETRFGEYVRRAAQEGREVEVTVFKIESQKGIDRVAIERQIRLELMREGFTLPWDDTRIGKEYGVP